MKKLMFSLLCLVSITASAEIATIAGHQLNVTFTDQTKTFFSWKDNSLKTVWAGTAYIDSIVLFNVQSKDKTLGSLRIIAKNGHTFNGIKSIMTMQKIDCNTRTLATVFVYTSDKYFPNHNEWNLIRNSLTAGNIEYLPANNNEESVLISLSCDK